MGDFLSKDALWDVAADLPIEDVRLIHPVTKKCVGTIRMRGLTGAEVERYEQAVSGGNGKQVSMKNAMARLVVISAVNDDGTPYFDPRDMLKLSQSPSWMVVQMFQAAGKLSGVSEEDVKEMTADFDDAQSSDAGTD